MRRELVGGGGCGARIVRRIGFDVRASTESAWERAARGDRVSRAGGNCNVLTLCKWKLREITM